MLVVLAGDLLEEEANEEEEEEPEGSARVRCTERSEDPVKR